MYENNENFQRRDRHKRFKTREERIKKQESQESGNQKQTNPMRYEQKEAPIVMQKLPVFTCTKCGEPIQDLTAALNDKETGAPVHFDCVLKFLQGAEKLEQNERVVYIGQGRFAVVFFENPVDTRKFKINRIIEWENRDKKEQWRKDISSRFSQIF